MNWDEYKASTKHILSEFSIAIQKLEMDILMGTIDEAGKAARREDLKAMLEQTFAMQDQLKSIKDSPETMMGVLSDVLGIKGERRGQLMETARAISEKRGC